MLEWKNGETTSASGEIAPETAEVTSDSGENATISESGETSSEHGELASECGEVSTQPPEILAVDMTCLMGHGLPFSSGSELSKPTACPQPACNPSVSPGKTNTLTSLMPAGDNLLH